MALWKAGFSTFNWVDQPGAEITADNEATPGPATNVASYEAGVPWIATGLTDQSNEATITCVFEKDREVSCLSFCTAERDDDAVYADFIPYIDAADSVRWRLGSDPDTAGDVYDQTVTTDLIDRIGVHGTSFYDPNTHAITPLTARRLDCTIQLAAPINEFGIFRIGRLWAGPLFQFDTNHDYGHEVGWDEDDFEHQVRVFTGDFSKISDAEIDIIDELYQKVSLRKQFLFFPRLDQANRAMFSRFSNSRARRFRSLYFGRKSSAWSIQEDWVGV